MVKLGQGLVLVIVAVGLFAVIVLGANVHEKQECESWERYASESRQLGIRSEAWQAEQCKAHGLELTY